MIEYKIITPGKFVEIELTCPHCKQTLKRRHDSETTGATTESCGLCSCIFEYTMAKPGKKDYPSITRGLIDRAN
jgi:hypothetical protein